MFSISHPANMGQGHILGVWALLHIITVSPMVCNPAREESLDLGLCSDSSAHRALVAAGAAAALPDRWDSRCQGDPVALCISYRCTLSSSRGTIAFEGKMSFLVAEEEE